MRACAPRTRAAGRAVGMLVAILVAAPGGGAQTAQIEGAASRPAPPPKPNVLLIVADDLGVDMVGAYGEHPDPGNTPVIDSLASSGMLFRNAWSHPTCSPSRAALLTGRYGFRTTIGYVIDYDDFDLELSIDETSIADAVQVGGYRTAVVGKWHVAVESGNGMQHPLLMGFEHHRGPMENLPTEPDPEASYFDYDKAVDGRLVNSTVYATTDQVNDALELIEGFGADPWFVFLSFSAPHAPYHKPPPELHTRNLPPLVSDDYAAHARAMAEAMDTEIGRLLASLAPDVLARTFVIFLGDNGSAKPATTLPFLKDHAKTTVYEGGVNIPLIVAGPGVVQGAECAALAGLTDIFSTVTDIAGVGSPTAEDSVSLKPYFGQPDLPTIRREVYTEFFKPNGVQDPYATFNRVLRGNRYKLIYRFAQSWTLTSMEFYDLLVDPFELNDLLLGTLTPEEQGKFDNLAEELDEIIAQGPLPP